MAIDFFITQLITLDFLEIIFIFKKQEIFIITRKTTKHVYQICENR